MERYKLVRSLGAGSSGVVSLVIEKQSGNEYVMKRIPLNDVKEETKTRALREVKVLGTVDHPNIVKFKSSFVQQGGCHIIMEKCECTLAEAIETQEGQPFPENVLIEWMAEMLCAVQFIHTRRIIHRDITSGNIFLSKKNHLKLGDFGVCKVLHGGQVCAKSFIGTPYFLAPEVCEGKEYNELSDIWSLGVVFYEMCTHHLPFQGNNILGVLHDIINGEPASFSSALDPRFEKMIRLMLTKDPSERPTAQYLLEKHLVLPSSHPSHPSHTPTASRLIQARHGPTVSVSPAPSGPSAGATSLESPSPSPQPVTPPPSSHQQPKVKSKAPLPRKQQQLHLLIRKSKAPQSMESLVDSDHSSSSPSPKSLPADNNRLSKSTVHDSASQQRGFQFQLASPEEHQANIRRIKSAKGKLDVAQLKKEAQQQRQQMCHAEIDTAIFIPRPHSAMVPSGHQDSGSVERSVERSSKKAPQSFTFLERTPPPLVLFNVERKKECSAEEESEEGHFVVKLAEQPQSPPGKGEKIDVRHVAEMRHRFEALLQSPSLSLDDFDFFASTLHKAKVARFGMC